MEILFQVYTNLINIIMRTGRIAFTFSGLFCLLICNATAQEVLSLKALSKKPLWDFLSTDFDTRQKAFTGTKDGKGIYRMTMPAGPDSLPFSPIDFPDLQELHLIGCMGAIPVNLNVLKNLQVLSITFIGPVMDWNSCGYRIPAFPSALYELKNLKVLIINSSPDFIDERIQELDNLEYLKVPLVTAPVSPVIKNNKLKVLIFSLDHDYSVNSNTLTRENTFVFSAPADLSWQNKNYRKFLKSKRTISNTVNTDQELVVRYAEGTLAMEGKIINGRPDGELMIFAPKSVLLADRTYERGRPKGNWTVFIRESFTNILVFTGNRIIINYHKDGKPYGSKEGTF